MVGLQNSSYTLNEGMSEETIAICVVLDGPAEGLATDLSFNVTFSTHEDIASNATCMTCMHCACDLLMHIIIIAPTCSR